MITQFNERKERKGNTLKAERTYQYFYLSVEIILIYLTSSNSNNGRVDINESAKTNILIHIEFPNFRTSSW